MPDPVTLVWFRHDLRLDDNPALIAAAARGAVVPVFIWAPEEEAPWEPGAASRWWLHQSLEKLAASLAKAGAPLVIRRGPSLATLAEPGRGIRRHPRRLEPPLRAGSGQARHGDQAGAHGRRARGRELQRRAALRAGARQDEAGQALSGVHALLAGPARPRRAGRAGGGPAEAPGCRAGQGQAPRASRSSDLGLLPEIDWAGTMRKTWSPGEAGAAKRLAAFLDRGLAGYGTERDRPDHEGTSSLSPHLHFGEISPRRVWHAVREAAGGKPAAKITGSPEVYLRELGWREFASHLLYHFPHTTDAPLRADYARFPWVEDPVGLRAWQRGRTGYPVVDAGHAAALGDRLDAQPRADDRGELSGQGSAGHLAGGGPLVLGHARRCRSGRQHARLAVGRRLRGRRRPLLPGLQSDDPGHEVRSRRRRTCGAGCRSWPASRPATSTRRPRPTTRRSSRPAQRLAGSIRSRSSTMPRPASSPCAGASQTVSRGR